MSSSKRVGVVRRRRRAAVLLRPPRGVTLVEMLVAMTISLVLVYSMVLVFESVSNSVSDHRSTIEMSSQLRMVAHRLQLDLEHLTVPVRPWADPEGSGGYFEIYDGPAYDWDGDAGWDPNSFNENEANWNTRIGVSPDPTVNQNGLDPLIPNTVLGDPDDMIAATVHSSGEPFRGRYQHPDDPRGSPPRIVESDVAEVIWWTAVHDINRNGIFDADDRLVLFRRAVLVRPDLVLFPQPDLAKHYKSSDISARFVASAASVLLVANSLEDLSKRENRFMHVPKALDNQKGDNLTVSPNYPYENMLIPSRRAAYLLPSFLTDETLVSHTAAANGVTRTVEWSKYVIASNVLAFDVRVFDPTAPLYNLDGEPVGPGDPGFTTIVRANAQPTPIGRGAFVDLAYGLRFPTARNSASVFSGPPDPKSRLFFGNTPMPTYDTWSMHYEYDGLDQDADGTVDQGTNGFDENRQGGVDDELERETAPPYAVPLSGIQVTLRVDEPGTRQVRQSSVVVDFTPE